MSEKINKVKIFVYFSFEFYWGCAFFRFFFLIKGYNYFVRCVREILGELVEFCLRN